MIDDYPLYGCTSQTLTMAHVLLQLFCQNILNKSSAEIISEFLVYSYSTCSQKKTEN